VIVVDTSVWIDHLNDHPTAKVQQLRALVGRQPLLVGDLILCEVLQGLRTDAEARRVETALRSFDIVAMLNPELAVAAAANYRRLGGLGITIRRTIDVIIGTYCIVHGYSLLHGDRDFEPMERHLGLQAA
jgi:predicted nucleic acid-binding protein